MMIRNLHEVIRLMEGKWAGKRALVMGDVMLDRYVWGEVERISPEAPVPVVFARRRSDQPGGAANVAMNFAGLGVPVSLLGFCGVDAEARLLADGLRAQNIASSLVSVESHPTTSKLRILGGQQQMLRLDVETPGGYPAEAFEQLLGRLDQEIQNADVLVLSDYAKGVLTEEVCRHAIEQARRRGIPVLVDPKHRSFARYRGATTICPNLQELSVATGFSKAQLADNLELARGMVREFDLESLTVTLSEKGIAVLTAQDQIMAPALARQVFDVSGAGDTVLATLAIAYACGLDTQTSIELANVAASIVVGKVGTVPVTLTELMHSLMPEIDRKAEEKVLSLERMQTRAAGWRAAGEKVVFTNGCFDLLHIGHITLLEDARRQGDRLVVAINSDASVQRLKGPSRPIVGEEQRARVLAALASVDAVVVFDEPTPLEAIIALKPDVIVKGGDYTEATVVGAAEVRSWGGQVVIVPTVEGFSTTRLIARATEGC
jgi:D-beta-D-heptose 7-phosphate kinase/D-beta-D-heptose 1-phosphate adenosyltransferase